MVKKYFSNLKKKFLSIQTAFVVKEVVNIAGLLVLMLVDFNVVAKVIIFAFLYALHYMVSEIISACVQEKQNIPKLSKRFTKTDEDGAVKIEKEDLQQAILYLYEIEEKLNK